MPRHLLFLVTLFLCSLISAQNQLLLDSLLLGARNAENDSIRVEYHYELCYQWAEYNFDSAWFHASRMEEIADGSANQILVYQAFAAKGLAHDYQYSFDSAIFYYTNARELAEDIDYRKGVAISTFNIGVVHYYTGEMEKAIDKYLEAEKVYLEIDDKRNLSVLYNNMGIIYRHTKKYVLAKDSYLKSLEIKRERNDLTGISNTLTNLSTVYQYLGEYQNAKEASEEVLELSREHGNSGAYLFELVNLGKIHLALNKPENALRYYEEVEKLLDESEKMIFSAHVYQQLSRFYLDKGELAKTSNYLDLVDQHVTEGQLNVRLDHFLTKTDYYRAIGRPELALQALQSSFDLREQLIDNEVAEKTTELEQLHEKEKRETEIARLNFENDLNELLIEKNLRERNALILGSVLVVGLATLFYSLFRQKKKSLSERETLLKEIHHRVKNNLQIISSLLNLQAGSLEDEAAADAVKEGQHRVRSMAIIHEKLYKETDLRGVDILDYLENLLDELFAAFGIDREKVKYKLETNNIKMDIDTVIPLGLILTELITNSLKYAFVRTNEGLLQILLKEEQEQLQVTVKDNGVGVSSERLESSNSFGWKMINSLSRKLKADIDVASDNGTIIQLSLSRYKLIS